MTAPVTIAAECPRPARWGTGERSRLYWTGRNMPMDRPGRRWARKAGKLAWMAAQLLKRLSRLSVADAHAVLVGAIDAADRRPPAYPVGPPAGPGVLDQLPAPASSRAWPDVAEVVTVSTRSGPRRAKVEAADHEAVVVRYWVKERGRPPRPSKVRAVVHHDQITRDGER